MTSTPSGVDPADDVEVRLPADGVYAAVLRTTAAGLAARLDFTIDDVEDLRMAVGEAVALLVAAARPGADLVATFRLSPGRMVCRLRVPTDEPAIPDRDSFGWQVLTTLTRRATAAVDGDTVELTLDSVSALAEGPDAAS